MPPKKRPTTNCIFGCLASLRRDTESLHVILLCYIQTILVFDFRNFVYFVLEILRIWGIQKSSSSLNFPLENNNRDKNYTITSFLKRFRDPLRVPRIKKLVPRIRENRVPRIRKIGSLQVHTGYLTFSLQQPTINLICISPLDVNRFYLLVSNFAIKPVITQSFFSPMCISKQFLKCWKEIHFFILRILE